MEELEEDPEKCAEIAEWLGKQEPEGELGGGGGGGALCRLMYLSQSQSGVATPERTLVIYL